MSSRIEKNLDFIKALETPSAYKRKRLLKSASEDNILALVEIAKNTLDGKLELNHPIEKKLKRHRKNLRHFAKRRPSIKSKKKFLIQKGGFLPYLVSPLLSIIGSIAGKVVSDSLGL
jgi:hypothetical protein